MAAYTAYVISQFSVKSSGPELVAQVEKAVTNPPRPHIVIDLHKKKILRRPSGETPEEKLERRYQALQAEKKRAAGAKTCNDAQLYVFLDCAHQAWQLYTSQLSQTVEKLGWDKDKRQQAWDMGHTLYTYCVHEYMERQGELKAERLQKKAEKVQAGAEKLVQLANKISDDTHVKDIEKLIVESNRQVDALKEISKEASDVDMIDLANDWTSKLVLSSKKLKE